MALLKFLFSYKGRINRRQYWLFQLCVFIVAGIAVHAEAKGWLGVEKMVIILFAPLWYCEIPIHVKRFHDLNRPGSHLGALLGWFYVFLVCAFGEGTKGENNYGHPPDQDHGENNNHT